MTVDDFHADYAESVNVLREHAERHRVWVWRMTLSGRHTTAELRTLARQEDIKVSGVRRDDLVQALAEVYAAREPVKEQK